MNPVRQAVMIVSWLKEADQYEGISHTPNLPPGAARGSMQASHRPHRPLAEDLPVHSNRAVSGDPSRERSLVRQRN